MNLHNYSYYHEKQFDHGMGVFFINIIYLQLYSLHAHSNKHIPLNKAIYSKAIVIIVHTWLPKHDILYALPHTLQLCTFNPSTKVNLKLMHLLTKLSIIIITFPVVNYLSWICMCVCMQDPPVLIYKSACPLRVINVVT